MPESGCVSKVICFSTAFEIRFTYLGWIFCWRGNACGTGVELYQYNQTADQAAEVLLTIGPKQACRACPPCISDIRKKCKNIAP